MPRPRKYDYQKDYPIKKAIYIKITVEQERELEKIGLKDSDLSELVEKYLLQLIEKNRKKD